MLEGFLSLAMAFTDRKPSRLSLVEPASITRPPIAVVPIRPHDCPCGDCSCSPCQCSTIAPPKTPPPKQATPARGQWIWVTTEGRHRWGEVVNGWFEPLPEPINPPQMPASPVVYQQQQAMQTQVYFSNCSTGRCPR